jgi:Tfp pilus assembly protein PilV
VDTPFRPRHSLRPLKPRLRAAAGFTVIEVFFASFVMIFGITSAILVMQSGLRALDTARNTTLASQIIQSEMERVRLLSWGAVNALPQSATIRVDDILPSDLANISDLRSRFSVTRAANDVAGKIGEMKEISVTVTWRGLDRQSHVRTSTTHYCKEGLYAYYYTKARS